MIMIKFMENFNKLFSVMIVQKKNRAVGQTYQYVRKIKQIFGLSLCKPFRRNPSENNADVAVVHGITMATLALKDGDADKSDKKLRNTLNLAEMGNFSVGIVTVCDLLSSLAMKSGNFERAEDFLIRALDTLENAGVSEDDNLMVSFYLKLCRVYSQSGNNEMSEFGFKNCLRLQKNKLRDSVKEEDHLLWMTILYWYGKFLAGQGRLEEAKRCFKNCYLSAEKVSKILPHQIMVVLYNLGEVCQMLEQYDEATKYLLIGISLDSKALNPDLAYFYLKLCKISLWRELHEEAALWCSRGKKLAEKFNIADAEKESSVCLEKLQNLIVN